MKRILVLLIFGILVFAMPVYASSWLDEGNYNPNWQSKCGMICSFDDEKDVAGIFKSLAQGQIYSFGREVSFSKSNLDFSIHDLPYNNNFSMILDGVDSIKIRYNQMFSLRSYPEIIYVYHADLTKTGSGEATLEHEYGESGEYATVRVNPSYGYKAKVTYQNGNNTTILDAQQVSSNVYQVPYTNNDVHIKVSFSQIQYQYREVLGIGVSSSMVSPSVIYQGDHKTVYFTVKNGFRIVSVKLNGNNVTLQNDNSIEFDVTEDVVVEVETAKSPTDHIVRNGNITFDYMIDKKDRNGQFLSGVEFIFKDQNETFQIHSVTGNHCYEVFYPEGEYHRKIDSNDMINGEYLLGYTLLPQEYQNMIDSVKKYGDLNSYHLSELSSVSEDYNEDHNYSVKFYLYLPFILEEKHVPLTFSKKSFIVAVPVSVEFVFYVPDNGSYSNSSNLMELSISTEKGLMFFDKNAPLFNGSFTKNVKTYGSNALWICLSAVIPNDFTELPTQGAGSDPSLSGCIFEVVNDNGTPKLKVSNYVNDNNTVVAWKNEELKYRVVVENIGNATSTDNVIVTNVPEKIEYVEGSASDNGVYDETTHTITWYKKGIEEGEKVVYSYRGRVASNAEEGVNYIGISSINSNEVPIVYSDETVVKLLMKNPNTFNTFIIVLFVMIVFSGVFVFQHSFSKK